MDDIRHFALQLAAQLPRDPGEAAEVVKCLEELVNSYFCFSHPGDELEDRTPPP